MSLRHFRNYDGGQEWLPFARIRLHCSRSVARFFASPAFPARSAAHMHAGESAPVGRDERTSETREARRGVVSYTARYDRSPELVQAEVHLRCDFSRCDEQFQSLPAACVFEHNGCQRIPARA